MYLEDSCTASLFSGNLIGCRLVDESMLDVFSRLSFEMAPVLPFKPT